MRDVDIKIDEKLCKKCMICVKMCPEKVYGMREIPEKGKKMLVAEHPEKCNGCRMCELFCPDFAINVIE